MSVTLYILEAEVISHSRLVVCEILVRFLRQTPLIGKRRGLGLLLRRMERQI